MQKPSERLKRKVEKENLWLFVLSVLRRQNLNGIQIKTLVTRRFGFLTGNVTVYKVLYLLEKGGYVKAERNRRNVVYRIRSKGRKELQKARRFLMRTTKNL